MRRTNLLRVVIFGALTVGASAQVRGPVMGYLPDNGALRTLYGIPAAGWVGDAVTPDRPLSHIEMSPDQSRALAIAADTGALMLLTPATGVTVHVNGAASGADRIVFSPSGTAAALWFSAGGHMQVVSGLAATPAVRDIDASFLGGDPAGLAVSDDGQWVAGAWSSSVYAFGPDGRASVLPVAGPAEALCFFHGRADVAVITAYASGDRFRYRRRGGAERNLQQAERSGETPRLSRWLRASRYRSITAIWRSPEIWVRWRPLT